MKRYLLILLFCFSGTLLSQVEPITLFQQFNGRLDFTGVGNTLNASANPGSCDLLSESSAELLLQPTETIVSAHLYWSSPWVNAIGGDFNVMLNGSAVSATRDFHLIAGTGNTYFAAYADVTAIVQATGNGTYTFSGLEQDLIATGACSNGTNYGGWAMYVIYEDPALTQNQISLFDGLEFVSANNPSIDITIGPLDVASDQFSKISFLAWEGDIPNPNMESLTINGQLISNAQNPPDNAFNGTNSYTGSTTLWNMDFDAYDLLGIIAPGDADIDIALTSSQDFVMVNNIITNVNSELPDATITIDAIGVLCDNSDIDVDYTVSNIDSTEALEPGLPIAFYADGVLVGQAVTTGIIAIGGSESGTVTLNFAPPTPTVFNLRAVADDDGTGMGTVDENNENNNFFDLVVDLSQQGLDLGPDLFPCVNEIVTIGQDLGSDFTYQWYFNGTFLPSATGPFYNPTLSGTYTLEAFRGFCTVNPDMIDVTFQPDPVAGIPDDLEACDGVPNDGFAVFDLTLSIPQIQNGQTGTTVTFYRTQGLAESANFPFATPNMYTNTTASFQTVWARLEVDAFGCFDVVPLNLIVNDSPSITSPISDYFLCDLDGDGFETFDLTSKDAEILNTLVDVDLSYHESELDAQNNTAPIIPADAYVSSNTVVWVRAVNYENGDPNGAELCTTVGSFNLVLGQVPVFNVLPEITACDDEIADGITEFDLNSNNTAITGGNTGLNVTYYSSLADAQAPMNALAVFYTNQTNPEAVWVRVEDNMSGCYGIFESQLVVIARPEVFQPDDLIYCDDDNDGFGTFTLEDASEQAVGGNPSGTLVVTYHLTQPDADNNVLPLMSPYDNEVPFDQVVYIRVSDLATGCYNTTIVHLIVEQTPQITDPAPLVVCDTDADGFAVFNLIEVEDDILFGLTG
ncbi:CARDB domain-containing protein, partial [Patiriisocius marinistellae]|uniref:CARDB domain-containing protein n=1 Tax=Patiriisocius marinistellae TaxID=2494560 RepID=UPI00125E293E